MENNDNVGKVNDRGNIELLLNFYIKLISVFVCILASKYMVSHPIADTNHVISPGLGLFNIYNTQTRGKLLWRCCDSSFSSSCFRFCSFIRVNIIAITRGSNDIIPNIMRGT